jgi:hypothetical protein
MWFIAGGAFPHSCAATLAGSDWDGEFRAWNGAAIWARVMNWTAEPLGRDNQERRSQEMMKRGRLHHMRWRNWIEGGEASLRNKRKRTKTNKNQRMKGKPKKHEQPKSETRNKQVEECVETAS